MVFHVDSRLLQLKPSAFAIPAGWKPAAFDAGNFMLSRVLAVVRHGVNTGMRNFFTRRVEHVTGTSDQFSMAGFRGEFSFRARFAQFLCNA